MNRDEAKRCVSIADECFSKGEYKKAFKFISKARLMDESIVSEETYKKMEEYSTHKASNDINHQNPNQNKNNVREETTNNNPTENGARVEYTEHQVEQVEKAKKCKNFYELLNVTKTAATEDLKKAYKKMALKFHPDKNKAPGSGEVFKAVSNAYTVLNDPTKRREYDMFGSTENRNNNQSSTSPFTQNRFYNTNITPEELFAQFFGNMAMHSMGMGMGMGMGFNTFGFNGNRIFTNFHNNPFRAARPRQRAAPQRQNHSYLIQLMPVLLFIIVSILSHWLQSEPAYSFQKDEYYVFKKDTKLCKVPYYVKSGFSKEYHGQKLAKLEIEIEEIYLRHLQNECYSEQRTREHLRMNAMLWGNKKAKQNSQNYPTPSCDEYMRIKKLIDGVTSST